MRLSRVLDSSRDVWGPTMKVEYFGPPFDMATFPRVEWVASAYYIAELVESNPLAIGTLDLLTSLTTES
jgi:hypothetical protein